MSVAIERSRISGEDRLTEFLALVLESDRDARTEFCGIVGQPSHDRASVSTQLPLLNGRRVDLEIQLQDGRAWSVIWVEAKTDAVEQPNQLRDYRQELIDRYGDRGTLVALGRSGSPLLDVATERRMFLHASGPLQVAVPGCAETCSAR